MLDVHIIWDLVDEPEGNVAHVTANDLTPEEVDEVLLDSKSERNVSRSSGEEITFGRTSRGRYIVVVWQHVMDDPLTIRPITAYEVPEPRWQRRGKKR
jgi:hypothetical protein